MAVNKNRLMSTGCPSIDHEVLSGDKACGIGGEV